MKNLLLSCSILFLSSVVYAQEATQVIYGKILDNISSKPLENVAIELLNYIPLKVTTTDENGSFTLQDVPLGKHRLLITHDKYEMLIVPEVEVTSGKQIKLALTLEEVIVSIREIAEVKTKVSTRDVPNNAMALIGIRSFTVDDVGKFAGARNDPSRLIANYAGVHIHDDNENGIVIRGNSHLNVLWQLEGIPIATPNHLSLTGYVSSYLPMISTNIMRNSDILNGAFPAQYGNAIGGVFDMGLRSGNKNLHEGTVQFSILGLEVGIEGPIAKKDGSSFIFSFRRSPFELFHLLNIDYGSSVVPVTSDMAFKIDLGETALGKFSIFGLAGWGVAGSKANASDTDNTRNVFINNVTIQKDMGVLGLKHRVFFSNKKKTYLQSTIGLTIDYEDYTEDTSSIFSREKVLLENSNSNIGITFKSYLNHSFNYTHTLRLGITETLSRYRSFFEDKRYQSARRNFKGNILFTQAYAQYLVRFSKKLKMNVGVNIQHLSLNNKFDIGPRFALNWAVTKGHKFSIGYGLHQQTQPFRLYFNQEEVDGKLIEPNRNLGSTEVHHFIFAYDWNIINNWRLKAEAYYQLYTKVPVPTTPSPFSLISAGQEHMVLRLVNLENTGYAKNMGLELTLEKFFSRNYYGLFTAALMESKYEGSNKKWYFTPFHNQLLLNLLLGKVFKIGPKKANAITMDLRVVYASGKYYTPIDLVKSRHHNHEVKVRDKLYSLQTAPYWRIDFKIGAYFNNRKSNISHLFYIDMINITNHINTLYTQYNVVTKEISIAEQSGFLPFITYKLTFGLKKKRA